MIQKIKHVIPGSLEPHFERSKGFLGEFRKFAMRGNVIDLAIGVIIGAAFGKIVNSIVNDVVMSPLGPLLGKVDFKTIFITLNGSYYPSLDAAKKAGAPVIQVGNFAQVVIEFTIVAFVIFLVVRQINRFTAKKEAGPPPPDKKDCPQCLAQIPIKATRCMHCTQPVA